MSYIITVWNLRKFTVSFLWQKFREIDVFTTENTKELIWRNFSWVTVNFSFFHTVRILLPRFCSKNSVKSIFLPKYSTLNWFDEKNLRGSKLHVFPHWAVLWLPTTEWKLASKIPWNHNMLFSREIFQVRTL